MKVLLSIKPEYAERILDGQKHFKFRRAIFKNEDVKTVVIYATLPIWKVIGEFDIEHILIDRPKKLWAMTSEYSGVTKRIFNQYFDGRETGYAIKIKKPRRYRKSLNLNHILESEIAPQSFCYLS